MKYDDIAFKIYINKMVNNLKDIRINVELLIGYGRDLLNFIEKLHIQNKKGKFTNKTQMKIQLKSNIFELLKDSSNFAYVN